MSNRKEKQTWVVGGVRASPQHRGIDGCCNTSKAGLGSRQTPLPTLLTVEAPFGLGDQRRECSNMASNSAQMAQ